MQTSLPTPILGYFQAQNSGKTDSFLELFTAEAVVADEGQQHRGEAIKAWMDNAIAKYHPLHAEVTQLEPEGRQLIATAQVSGSFPGSPIQLRYQFTLQEGKIAALSIGL
jgi:hypothetical protein